jgi:hypothetical protein
MGLLSQIRQSGGIQEELAVAKTQGAWARTTGWVCYTRHEPEWRFAKCR